MWNFYILFMAVFIAHNFRGPQQHFRWLNLLTLRVSAVHKYLFKKIFQKKHLDQLPKKKPIYFKKESNF